MIKILFICHGNICRSPMAEFVMKRLVHEAGRDRDFFIASAATSSEELGNPVYPPVRRILTREGIDCAGKTARRMTAADYDNYDLLICMDRSNLRDMTRICGGDPDGKFHLLMSYTGSGAEVSDPWWTGEFESAWRDVSAGCAALLEALTK